MSAYEYRVIPAPAKGAKAKGVKTPEDRFAHALQELMNEMGAEGWEYQRAETLPSTERAGLTGSTTNWRHVLVFRRVLSEPARQTASEGARIVGPLISPPRAPANDPRPAKDVHAHREIPDPAEDRTSDDGNRQGDGDLSLELSAGRTRQVAQETGKFRRLDPGPARGCWRRAPAPRRCARPGGGQCATGP